MAKFLIVPPGETEEHPDTMTVNGTVEFAESIASDADTFYGVGHQIVEVQS